MGLRETIVSRPSRVDTVSLALVAADGDESDDRAEHLAEGLSTVIARLRKDMGWSLEDLADEAGLHRTYIGLVERGERHLSVAAAQRVALAVGLPLSTMIEIAEAELAGEDTVAEFEPRLVLPAHVRAHDILYEITGLGPEWVESAINETHARLDIIDERLIEAGSPPLAELVELANLSSMIGNVLRAGLAAASGGRYLSNEPHTYPDLVSQDSSVPDLEIKMALESNKPKGHLPKPGLHLTCRYVLADRTGSYKRGRENRGSVPWIWEIRIGFLNEADFSISNTKGDSGKTAVIKTGALDRLTCIFFNPAHNPYVRARPGHD